MSCRKGEPQVTGAPSANPTDALSNGVSPAPPSWGWVEVEVPDARNAYTNLRSFLIPTLPKAPELALGHVLQLPALVATSFELSAPVVALYGDDSESREAGWLLAAHVRSGAEFVAQLTTGNSPSHRIARAAPGRTATLVPNGAPKAMVGADRPQTASALAVVGDVVVAGPQALLESGAVYAAVSLMQRAREPGQVRCRLTRAALQGLKLRWLQEGWAAQRRQWEAAASQMERSRQRPADFLEPVGVLTKLDGGVRAAQRLIDEVSALTCQVALDASGLSVRAHVHLSSAAALRLRALPFGKLDKLASLPTDTGFAFSVRAPRGGGWAEGFHDFWGQRAKSHDLVQLDSATRRVAASLDGEQALGIRADGSLVMTGSAAQADDLSRGVGDLFASFTRAPLLLPLSTLAGQPQRVPSARRSHKIRFLPAAPGARGQTTEVSFEVDEQQYWIRSASRPVLKTTPAKEAPTSEGALGQLREHDWLAPILAERDAVFAAVYVNLQNLRLSSAPAPAYLEIGMGAGTLELWSKLSRPVIERALRLERAD